MARIINKAYEIANAVGRYFKTGTAQHMENMVKEAVYGILQIFCPQLLLNPLSAGQIFVLGATGCINTGGGSNYIISPGMVLFQLAGADLPELFYCSGGTFTLGGGQSAIFVISTANYTGNVGLGDIADPTGMTDGSTQNVHNIRTLACVAGTSSTPGYIGLYSTAVFLDGVTVQQDAEYVSLSAPINAPTSTPTVITDSSANELSYTTPNDFPRLYSIVARFLYSGFVGASQVVFALQVNGSTVDQTTVPGTANPFAMSLIFNALIPPDSVIQVVVSQASGTGIDINEARLSVAAH